MAIFVEKAIIWPADCDYSLLEQNEEDHVRHCTMRCAGGLERAGTTTSLMTTTHHTIY